MPIEREHKVRTKSWGMGVEPPRPRDFTRTTPFFFAYLVGAGKSWNIKSLIALTAAKSSQKMFLMVIMLDQK